jgi:hypothetical protein
MINLQANRIRRLNVLLGLVKKDIGGLGGAEWRALLDDVYFAVLGKRGGDPKQETSFHAMTTRQTLRVAQEGLRAWVPLLGKERNVPLCFQLEKQALYIHTDDKGFFSRRNSEDCPTMIYEMLAYLLELSQVRPADLLTCANEKCESIFVPLRKPHEGQKSYCSPKCSNLAAARAYRIRQGNDSLEKEKERSHRRYVKKKLAKYPKARIGRRPRKVGENRKAG